MCSSLPYFSASLELATRFCNDAARISKENDIVSRPRLSQFFYASLGRPEAARRSDR
jgi:hypothetical protein